MRDRPEPRSICRSPTRTSAGRTADAITIEEKVVDDRVRLVGDEHRTP
jgi:hypothetical protein